MTQGKLEPKRCFLYTFHFDNQAATNPSGCDLRDSKRLAGKELGQKGIRAALRMCGPQPVLWFPYGIHGPRCPRVPLAKFTLLGKNVSDLPLSTFSLNSPSHFHHFTGVLLWGISSFVGDHTHSPWSHPINTGCFRLQREPRTSL